MIRAYIMAITSYVILIPTKPTTPTITSYQFPYVKPYTKVCAKDVSSFMHLNFTRTYSAIEPQPASYFTVKCHAPSLVEDEY